jgi:hypothetical protein
MSEESIYAIIEKHKLQISYMAQRYPVLAKQYYRRWFLGLTLCPGYRFFHEKKRASKYKRFNTTANYFNFEEVLELRFDDWWDQNQVKLQSAIPTSYLENIHLSYSLTSKEIERQLAQKKAEYENSLSEEDLQLDNLTIIDNSSGIDHKEIDYIDKILSTRLIKYIKEIAATPAEFTHKQEFESLLQKNIYDLVGTTNINQPKPVNLNNEQNRVSEWNSDFYRIFWYAQFGYFYYDSDAKGKVGKAKERKFLESKTPNFSNKGDLNNLQARLFSPEWKDEFNEFIKPINQQFFSIKKLIEILNAFCPETLDLTKRDLDSRLPSPKNTGTNDNASKETYIKFPSDKDYSDFEDCIMWHEVKPNITALFSEKIQDKLSSAMNISKIFLNHTEYTDTVDSINPVKLRIISCFLPFLFQEDKTLKNKKYGSLTLLWKERPNLFIETENMFFGTTILLKVSHHE